MLCWTPEDLGRLIAGLLADGRTVIGPTVRDGVIIYDDITSLADLPSRWTDQQSPGHYRLAQRQDEALFGFTVGPHSWKPFFLPARLRLWQSRRTRAGMEVAEDAPAAPPLALLGVRACELAAMAVQDRALAVPGFADPHYAARRKAVFIVAVECGEAHGTCFCASMGTGPRVNAGSDLVLTELIDGGHRFVVRAGSAAGQAMLQRLGGTPATPADIGAADSLLARTAASMGRTLDTDGLPELLQQSRDSARWEDVAARCLGCTNCTLVCPTCFCTTVEDVTDLTGAQAERIRRWDSCFALDFSYVFGGPVRRSLAARYRQWLTHKLSSWHAQYGMSGCVGCGRCITWCPAGIDITAEAAAIRAASARPVEALR